MLAKMRETPPSLWRAAAVAVSVTLTVAIVSGIAMWALDRESFPTVGRGLWWAAQTVTTVGYGDVVPEDPVGRLLAVFLMITGVGFLTVVTGAVVSLFVSKVTAVFRRGDQERLERGLADVLERLERIEAALRERR
jgi:voltage-gated potassium channel Kch